MYAVKVSAHTTYVAKLQQVGFKKKRLSSVSTARKGSPLVAADQPGEVEMAFFRSPFIDPSPERGRRCYP